MVSMEGQDIASYSLSHFDPELSAMINAEDDRQRKGLELIASENFASKAVREVLGSCLTNKYSEGEGKRFKWSSSILKNNDFFSDIISIFFCAVGKRYYGGNEFIDQIESLCMQRALELYKLNVQPYSGSPANFAVYTALLQPHDRIMGLDLPSGGHLTHGFQTPKKKVSATSVYFESMPYIVSQETGLIDYDDLEKRAKMFLPKLLIAGGSAYPREWDYKRMRNIADSVGALLMVDMAHVSGLVAGGVAANPFEFADVVTSTTHKTLRGPRSGMIFGKVEYMEQINAAVFPSLQGGPHNHQIGALAVALKEAQQPEFAEYAQAVVINARALGEGLKKRGHVLATGGTDNHILLWDVRHFGLTGSKVDTVLEYVSITANKNSLPGDVSAINPGGVRLGTPALTTRGLKEDDFDHVAEFLHRACELAVQAQKIAEIEVQAQLDDDTTSRKSKKVLLKDFKRVLNNNEEIGQNIEKLKEAVESFSTPFYMPG
jgi:glycine hydroxymethyltransferase